MLEFLTRTRQVRGVGVEISASGLRESHAHDVMITKEAPNYRME